MFDFFYSNFLTLLRNILDFSIIAVLLYLIYRYISKSRAIFMFRGILYLLIFYLVVYLINLETLLWLMNLFIPGLFVGLAIIFQNEIRNLLFGLGRLQGKKESYNAGNLNDLESILIACDILMQRKKGMLIVFRLTNDLEDIIETGTTLNADLSSQLLLSIFEYETPLHDGAVILGGNRIIAAGCLLPLTEQQHLLNTAFGTRHRAAIGMSEKSDAIVLIVSEETGKASLAIKGNILYHLSLEELKRNLIKHLYKPQVQAVREII